jgi:hypothetical protein
MVKDFSLATALDPEAGKTNKEMTIRPTNTNKIFLMIFPPFCIVSVFLCLRTFAAFFAMFSPPSTLAVNS